MSGVYGRKIKMTIFGESHGASIGLVIDGLPPGLGIDIDFIKREMERRAPGRNLLSTQRQMHSTTCQMQAHQSSR